MWTPQKGVRMGWYAFEQAKFVLRILIAKFAFWEILDIVIGKVYNFTSMSDTKRALLHDLYQDNRVSYSHNFLRCITQSQESLRTILQSSNEHTLNQMLAWARNSLEHALNDDTIRPNYRTIVDGAIASINRKLWTTVVAFDQEITALYAAIWQPTNERARFCNEAGINQKFHAYWIVNWAQFTALQSNPQLVERFLRLCESTWCSPAVIASFREVLLPNTRINQSNSPQTRLAVIAAMRQDPVFEETITNTTFTDPAQRELLLAYLDWLRDDVTDAEHIRYREWLYDIYYLPFLQRTGRLQNQNRHQNKADFFASDECQRYIDEIIRPDFDRFNRITNLRNRNVGVYQNGWRLTGTGDATGVEFSPTPDSIEVKQNPRASYDVNSNANNTLKKIDVRDKSKKSIWTFRSNEKVPLDVLRRADRVVWTMWVQPQVSMKSLLNNATVAFEWPEENVTVEMNREQINNLLASVEPWPTITPPASLAVWWPNPSVPITTDSMVLSGTWEPWRNIEVSVWWTALPVVTVEPDGSWQVPVTWLTAWPINIQTRMSNEAGTWWEPSVHRLYTCTYVAPAAVVPPTEYPVFAPQAKTNVAVSTPVESDPFDVTGITRPTTARCAWWEISIDGWLSWTAAWTDLPVPVWAQMILRTTSSAAHNTRTACSVDIWGVVKSFFVTTEVAPTIAPLVFSEPVWSRIDGNTSTKALFGGTAPQNLSGWTIDVRDAAGTVVLTENNLQTTATGLRNREIDFVGLPTWRYTVRVTLWTQTQDKTMEYTASTQSPETPNDFPFPRKDDVALSVVGGAPNTVESKPVQITNITRPTEVRCASGEFTVDGWATWHAAWTAWIMIQPNGFLQVRIAASTEYAEETIATVAVGTKSSDFIVKTIDTPATIERPTINKPWSFVYWWAPVDIEWVGEKGHLVVVRDGATVLGTVRCDAAWAWKLPVGNLTEWNHALTVTWCDASWTEVAWLTGTLNIIVWYMRMEWLTGTRNDIAFTMHGEPNKSYHARRRKEWDTNWHEASGLLPAAGQDTITFGGLDLGHGKYEVDCYQDDAANAKKGVFTIDPLPATITPLVANQRRQVLTGTGEPGEDGTVKIKIWGNAEETKDIKVDAAWNWSLQLDDLVSGPCTIEATIAWNTVRQNTNLDIPSRRPQLNHGDIVVHEWRGIFDVSGYLPRECLDCNRVLIKDNAGNTLKTLDLWTRTRWWAFRDAWRNIADFGRHRRRDNSFETDMNINDLWLDVGKSMPLTIVPFGIDGREHKDEAVTFTVEHREDIRQRRATASKPWWIIKTSSVDFEWKAPWAKRVRLWKEGIGLWHGFLRGKSQIEEIDVVDGKWSANKTILKDGKQSWRVAAVDEQDNLGPSSPIEFTMKLPENEGKMPRWKKALPWNWRRKNKKGKWEEEGKEEKEGSEEKWGDEKGWGSEGTWGGSDSEKSKKRWLFWWIRDFIKWDNAIVHGLNKHVPMDWTWLGKFYGGMVTDQNVVVKTLNWTNKKAA